MPDLLILVSVVLVDSLLSRDFLMPLRSWLSRLSFLKLQTCLRFLFVLFKRADADIRITIHRARFLDLQYGLGTGDRLRNFRDLASNFYGCVLCTPVLLLYSRWYYTS